MAKDPKKKKVSVKSDKKKVNHRQSLLLRKAGTVAVGLSTSIAIILLERKLGRMIDDYIEKKRNARNARNRNNNNNTGNTNNNNTGNTGNTSYDPFNITGIKNKDELKKKCRDLYKIHHPDKGGDRVKFEHILDLCREQEEIINMS